MQRTIRCALPHAYYRRDSPTNHDFSFVVQVSLTLTSKLLSNHFHCSNIDLLPSSSGNLQQQTNNHKKFKREGTRILQLLIISTSQSTEYPSTQSITALIPIQPPQIQLNCKNRIPSGDCKSNPKLHCSGVQLRFLAPNPHFSGRW